MSSKDKDLDACSRSWARPRTSQPQRSGPVTSTAGRAVEPLQARSRRRGGSGEKTKPKDQGLQGKDKEIDEQLEEFAGKKRKKKDGEQEEGSGPLGEVIKEMRDVEQRLGKPDTGEETQQAEANRQEASRPSFSR